MEPPEKSWLGKTTKRIKKIGGAALSIEFDAAAASAEWMRLGRELADALSNLAGWWLIQIDELPVFVLKLLQTEQESGPSPRVSLLDAPLAPRLSQAALDAGRVHRS